MNTEYNEESPEECAKAESYARKQAVIDLRDLLLHRVPEVAALIDLVEKQGSEKLKGFFNEAGHV